MKHNGFLLGLLCGILSAAVNFWLIPNFFMRGIPDFIWITLMLLIPAILAVLLLAKDHPSRILWSMLVQSFLVILYANPISKMLGYQLGNFGNDLFDYIGFGLYVFGWITASSFVQFLTLLVVRKIKSDK